MHNFKKLVFSLYVAIFIAGCTTPQWQKSWGLNLYFDNDRIKKAAYDAIVDPQTYIPAAGALVFAIGDWDHKVSDWATEHTPVFGSQNTARNVSYYLLWSLVGETVVTAIVVPDGNDSKKLIADQAKNLGMEVGAFGVTQLGTSILKYSTERQRPNRKNNQSFPSGHASGAFTASTLSNRNLDLMDMPNGLRTGLQVGNILLASGTAWARVEGNEHFPSDVLAGAALGHLLSVFIYKGFMNLPDDKKADFTFLPYNHGIVMSFTIRY
jgi:membrane-associated phospholipid phosphatase